MNDYHNYYYNSVVRCVINVLCVYWDGVIMYYDCVH